MVYGVWYMVYGVRCTVYGVLCTVYDVRCTMYDVRYTLYGSLFVGVLYKVLVALLGWLMYDICINCTSYTARCILRYAGHVMLYSVYD